MVNTVFAERSDRSQLPPPILRHCYVLRINEPFMRGAVLETPDGTLNFRQGESFAEFHHLFSDIINGTIAAGLNIKWVLENPRPDSDEPLEDLEPDSEEHRARYLPFGLSVVAQKTPFS